MLSFVGRSTDVRLVGRHVRPTCRATGCRSAREGARALPLAGGGTGGPSPRRPLFALRNAAAHWPAATLAAMDLALIERTVARLHEQEPTFDWVGVYLLDGDTLVLGPFRGLPTEHDRIAIGDGVCGAVAKTGRTETVPDVRNRPGHIACDIDTRSELVAPIIRTDGRLAGVLDLDSNTLDAFGEREIALIEEAAAAIASGA
jgi:L-methionine (R)-S-oxide reductase